jgi:hypothetical protein
MGYWPQSEEGTSFADAENGQPMVWGDSPADIVDHALWQIRAVFLKDVGRMPTKAEVMAGLTFSTNVALDDLPTTVAEAEDKAARALLDVDMETYEQQYWRAFGGDVSTPRSVIDAGDYVNRAMAKVIKG